jgi:pantothenate kinase
MLLDLPCNQNKSLITTDDGTLEFYDVNSKQIRISYIKYIKNHGLHEITYKEQYRAT